MKSQPFTHKWSKCEDNPSSRKQEMWILTQVVHNEIKLAAVHNHFQRCVHDQIINWNKQITHINQSINQYGYLYSAFCVSKRFTWQIIEIAQQNTLLNPIIKKTTKSNSHTHNNTPTYYSTSFSTIVSSRVFITITQRPRKTDGF